MNRWFRNVIGASLRIGGLLTLGLLGLRAAEFAPVFTSGAVLQRGVPVALWGQGRDGEKVTVTYLEHSVETTVSDGRWRVTLPALEANPGAPLTLRGDQTVTLTDVAVGEVWICAGQSNMEYRLNQCAPHTDAVLAQPNQPTIRQLKIPHRTFAQEPWTSFSWKPFDRAAAPYFSAVAYYFAASLQKELSVPIGLVNCSFGGTPIEAWMSREAILAAGSANTIAEHEKKMATFATPEAYEAAWKEFTAAQKAWDARKKAGATPAELGPQPQEPYGYRYKRRPTGLREGMLQAIIPYTARGVLWYQGENNSDHPDEYARLLPQLIAEWRQDWNQPNWPFFIAQIASSNSKEAGIEGWASFREAQRRVATTTPECGWVVTMDYGELGQVHPTQKQPVGERFARLALGRVYDKAVGTIQSPSARSVEWDGHLARVQFSDLKTSLVVRESTLPTLEIKLGSGAWQAATGRISADGQSLEVTPPTTDPAPTAIRYAWQQFCALSLYTSDGLPVSPWNLSIPTSAPTRSPSSMP